MARDLDPVIAGRHSGKVVRCVPAVKPALDKLEQASRNGNYWAMLAISGLKALTSGLLNKNNIYVQSNPAVRREFQGEVYLFICPVSGQWLSGGVTMSSRSVI